MFQGDLPMGLLRCCIDFYLHFPYLVRVVRIVYLRINEIHGVSMVWSVSSYAKQHRKGRKRLLVASVRFTMVFDKHLLIGQGKIRPTLEQHNTA